MATRMQQRRGTASQWTSANPVLNAGEMGWESDTNKFKIGDGTNHWADLDYFTDINSTTNPSFGTSIVFEGATADSFETTILATDPTADRTITIPDATGTIQLRVTDVSDTEIGYLNGVTSAIQTQLDDKSTASKTETLANKSISFGSNTVTSTLAQLNSAVSDADVASLAGTETLSNKTLTTPTINGPTITATGQTPTIHGIYLPAPHNIIFEGTTADDFETTLEAGEPTADRTITLPDASGTVALVANVAALSGATFTGAVSGTDLTLSGNLTVNGTTTNLNSTNLVIEDKNIVLGDTASPTDTTADGGGITLKGATDKTINWVDATDAWTSSEDFNLASGKAYEIAGTSVLSGSTLGSGVTGSSLTSVGTITSGTWNGTTIAVANGGTGITSFGTGIATFLGTPSSANLISAITDETGSGSLVFGTAPTLTNAVNINTILRGPEERWTVSATAATGTIPLDILTSGILYYTSNASANWTLNVRGNSGTTLNDSLATNDSITVVFFATNGATPYYQTGFQIDGSAITPKWQNGSAPSAGNANSIDIYSYTIVKTGNAAFAAFGSQTRFA